MNIGITVKRVGSSRMKITTNFGVTVQYDGVFNVFVKVDDRYKGKLSGLCGNFNGNLNDEFSTPNRNLVQNAASFGNSWKLEDSCPNVANVENPCKAGSKISRLAKKECSVLKQQPFSACNKVLNPNDGHIANCEYDVCGCDDNPKACLCEAYSEYVEACEDEGIVIKWKHLRNFAKCSKLMLVILFSSSVFSDYDNKSMSVADPCICL